MGAQAVLQLAPVSAFLLKLLQKNNSSTTVKSPARITTRCRLLFASHYSTTDLKREKDAKKRVVITGMGLVSVLGNKVDMFNERLLARESGIGLIDRFNASKLTTQFSGQIHGFKSNGYVGSKSEWRLDDCQRYCIVAGKKALENAALGCDECSKIDKERAGVLVGSCWGCSTVLIDSVKSFISGGYSKMSPFSTTFALTNMGSALLAIDLGFEGPNYSISAACATSNFCFCAAANHIRECNANLMIAGGVEACVTPIILGGFAASKALSKRNNDPQTASRPWEKDRDGFVIGEGAGLLVMESLEHAMKKDAPILAEYLGGAVNCDAYHITNLRSDNCGITVNYINAHATSTISGDLAEVNGLFKNTAGIKMNSTKSITGHSLGASGGLEAIATIKAIQTDWMNPTINQFVRDTYNHTPFTLFFFNSECLFQQYVEPRTYSR